MPEYRGLSYMRKKLAHKRRRVLVRYKYYEMKDRANERSLVIPPQMRQQYKAVLGWCAKSVDSLADRLVFREFENDDFEINEIFNLNNPDTLFDSSVLSALISSCSFVYVSPDKDGYPRLQVIDGSNATGELNPITGLLNEGYAVLQRDDHDNPVLEAHFGVGETLYYEKGQVIQHLKHPNIPAPLLVPIINRPDAKRPFGHSRISRSCMYFQRYAKRVLERSDVSAEFYSFPQKYILGLSQNAEQMDKWQATISSFLQFDKDDEGEHPTLGQFQQQSMSPYTEQLRTAAAAFAGETGLTLDDLGFVAENPSSAEAIKASHENLRLLARKAQRTFGSGFLNVGYIAACMRDDYTYQRSQFYLTKPKWEPVFEPDAAMLSSIGDGAIKLNQAVPGFVGEDNLRDLTGIVSANKKIVVAEEEV